MCNVTVQSISKHSKVWTFGDRSRLRVSVETKSRFSAFESLDSLHPLLASQPRRRAASQDRPHRLNPRRSARVPALALASKTRYDVSQPARTHYVKAQQQDRPSYTSSFTPAEEQLQRARTSLPALSSTTFREQRRSQGGTTQKTCPTRCTIRKRTTTEDHLTCNSRAVTTLDSRNCNSPI